MRRILAAVATLALCAIAPTARAASFDCDRARTPDERAICADRSLNDMDVKLTTTYDLLAGLFAMGTRGDLQDAQRSWLKARHDCGGDRACLRRSYVRRQGELQKYYDGISKPI